METLVDEIIHELGQMSIDELEEFREKWIKELSEKGFPEIVIDIFGLLVDLVIVKKGEKQMRVT